MSILASRVPLLSLATMSVTTSTEVYFSEQRLESIPSFTLRPSGNDRVRDQPPLARVMAFWDDAKLVDVGLELTLLKWA